MSLPMNITNFTLSIVDSKFQEFFVAISVEAYDELLQRVVSSGLVETECVHDGTNGENIFLWSVTALYNFYYTYPWIDTILYVGHG